MKKYDAYKPSSVDWIGEVPNGWKVMKTSWVFRIGSGTTPKSGDKSYYTEEGGFNWLQTGDLNDGRISETSKKITQKALVECNLKTYGKGSLVVAMYGATIGKVGILDIETTVNQACCVLNKTNDIDEIYAFYMFQAEKPTLLREAYGGGQPNISQDIISCQKIPVPPLSEQTAIAKYLDAKCAKIDNVVAIQQKRIELLKELKQSIITKAVTKGLDKNAKMKPSGVEWIGEVPNHWDICRLKNYCSLKGRIGWNGLRSDEFRDESYAYLVTGQDFEGDMIPWERCYQIDKDRYDEDPFIQLNNGDLLITKDGTIGKIAKVSNLDKPACLNSGIFVLKQKREVFSQDYIFWTLNSGLFSSFNDYTSCGTTILHLYQNVFEVMPMLVPPLSEQTAIATYLDKKCAAIDRQIAKIEKQIELLKEYKQSVITECVTGKRKVC